MEPFGEVEPITARDYTPEQVTTALAVLAHNGGALEKSVRELKAGGIRMTADALAGMRERHPNRYRSAVTSIGRKAEEEAAAGFLEIVHQAQEAMRDAIALEHQRIKRGDVRDSSASGRNLATIAGISGSKLLELTNRPSQIIEHRRPEEILRRLQSMGVVEGTATEVPNLPSPSDEASPSD